ncbi:M48 family metallopeptidase [Spongiimicrobium sp. 3-5]|uniref:M48 family metallopeptidase n=1 Tax=Spongiimicrobium sp. 3-5 TaxID=3332596 RepID=UPI00398013CB
MESNTLYYIIIGILILQFLIETLLDYLNASRFQDSVPAELHDVFDDEAYNKSQAYKKTNYRFGILTSSFSLLLVLAFLQFNGFAWVDGIARNLTGNPILIALVFFGIIMIGSDILSTPFAYYQTFVIEERFGFNKSTKKLFLLDKIKGWIMTAVLGGSILAVVIWFFQWAGTYFWLYAWLLVAVFSILMNLSYSRLIVPLFNKQTPLEEGSLKQKIESYSRKVGFELKNIFVIDGSKRSTKANAYFSGFGKEKRITLYDTLIHDLDEEEIVAVLAHEVGHYKRKHIIYNLSMSILLTGFTLFVLSLFINNPELSLAIGVQQPSFHAALIGFGILYSPISGITGLVMNYLSRTFEYEADNYAKNTFGAALLITSLKKMSKNSLSNLTPHPAYVFMHYSHPPLISRIKNLKA